jgi:N6-L-threonylcarbamoyladenine synthase
MIDAIAVGHRPGLIGSLLVGVAAAKALAWSLGKSLIGVDHVHAHLYAGVLGEDGEDEKRKANGDTLFPALGLVVSGGHTSLYVLRSWMELTRIGATIDDALGEAYDKGATILGLPYPGGPNLDRLATGSGGNERAHDFPVSRLSPESLDFSFSGLKTSLLYAVRGLPGPGGVFARDGKVLGEKERADLAASFQRAASRAVVLKLERAVERQQELVGGEFRSLLVGGGVTANSRVRREVGTLAAARGLELRLPRMEYCVDNAAMIAGLGYEMVKVGRVSDLSLEAVPTTAV